MTGIRNGGIIMIKDYDVYEISEIEWLIAAAAGYGAIFFVCLLFYHSFILAGACALAGVLVPGLYAQYRADKRKDLLLAQFKDCLNSLASSFASGRQMQGALAEAYSNLLIIYDEKTPMVSELKYMLRGMKENRVSEEELLSDFADRTHQEDIINFVDVYKACRMTGGDMERVIANSTQVMMDKMQIEKEIRTLTAQKKFEGRIISAMPLAVVLFLNIFSPEYLAVMYETVGGRIVMSIALGGIVFAYRMMMKLTEIRV